MKFVSYGSASGPQVGIVEGDEVLVVTDASWSGGQSLRAIIERGELEAASAHAKDRIALAMIEAAGGKAMALNWDLSDLSVIDAHVSKVEAAFGPVDILINNTGGPAPTPAAGQDPQCLHPRGHTAVPAAPWRQ